MENASKALIIAGEILIGVIILSILAYLFSRASGSSQSYSEAEQKKVLDAFNNKFEIYNRNNLIIHDIITVANLAKQFNNENQLTRESDAYIQVIFDDQNIEANNEEENSNLINVYSLVNSEDSTELALYQCIGIEYSNGRVNKIIFK